MAKNITKACSILLYLVLSLICVICGLSIYDSNLVHLPSTKSVPSVHRKVLTEGTRDTIMAFYLFLANRSQHLGWGDTEGRHVQPQEMTHDLYKPARTTLLTTFSVSFAGSGGHETQF